MPEASATAGGLRRLALRFEGMVQGVGFRWTCRTIARSLGCTGWVRNEYDGSVSMELQGTQGQVSEFFGALQADYNRRHLTFILDASRDVEPIPGEDDFGVRWA